MASSTCSAALKELLFYIASLEIKVTALQTKVGQLQTELSTHKIPTDLVQAAVIRFNEGETWKICYYNGYYKTAEVVIKDLSYLLSLKSDSGVDLTLNTFGIAFENGAWVFGTDIFLYSDGRIRSVFNSQDGLTVQFGRDVIGNAYQFTIERIN